MREGDLYPLGMTALLSPVMQGGRMARFAQQQGGGVVEGVRAGAARPTTDTNSGLAVLGRSLPPGADVCAACV